MSKLRKSVVRTLDELGECSGCHRIPERSFFYKGKQLPVCARCTGVFFGQCAALALNLFKHIPLNISIVFLSIMGVDWGIQELKIKESTNYRRLFTGFLGGFGLFNLYCLIFKRILKFLISAKCKNRSV